ncbi:uncharacterized protein FMAN_02867 [Fusarium mangiferae]|uniref:N-acetyltransferase domain-containing protein n=1 Tax=Fusarium mangiferae TaxID=192010 RepID=A0A1L7TDW1_FUSMA|nr:uncharacterized protein FMAN_02867 [Fusarium mangiferae]CVK93481.1 uncharacterized protein FMAN_02867 [Fusarium mangiferae]
MNRDVFCAVAQAVNIINQETDKLDRLANWLMPELTFIYVKPSHRKQGIGALLMREAFSRTEAEGVVLYLCSEPAAHDFYRKRGFQDIIHADIDLSKWAPPYSGFGLFRWTGMTWTPSKERSW